MEILFPLEFIVHGVPVSSQTKRPKAKAELIDIVRRILRLAG